MNDYIRLQIGSLYLALPRQEMAQINLAKDIHIERGIACVEFQSSLIPVIRFDEHLQTVQSGSANLSAQYVVTLATIDDTLKLNARFALQVDSTLKVTLTSFGPIPNLMKQKNNPITNWFEDSFQNRGFITHTGAIEKFINHLTQEISNEKHAALAS